MAWDEVLAATEKMYVDLAEQEEILFELLVSCRLRHQTGPPQLLGMPPAPTVIERTLWLPWLGQGSSWLWADYFGGTLTEEGDDG